jgi:hypothetical protein
MTHGISCVPVLIYTIRFSYFGAKCRMQWIRCWRLIFPMETSTFSFRIYFHLSLGDIEDIIFYYYILNKNNNNPCYHVLHICSLGLIFFRKFSGLGYISHTKSRHLDKHPVSAVKGKHHYAMAEIDHHCGFSFLAVTDIANDLD